MDVLTEIYISKEVWDEIERLKENDNLSTYSICTLSVKLSSYDSEKYILKLI